MKELLNSFRSNSAISSKIIDKVNDDGTNKKIIRIKKRTINSQYQSISSNNNDDDRREMKAYDAYNQQNDQQ